MQTRFFFILSILVFTAFPTLIFGKVITGAERTERYLPLLKGKRVGMVVNHTSIVSSRQTHLLDTLLKLNIQVVQVFAPEHGFRGNADAGEEVKMEKTVAPEYQSFRFTETIKTY